MSETDSTLISRSPDDTYQWGEALAGGFNGGEVVLMRGPIGAGKSVLARGIAAGLDIRNWRGSPTFNLVHEYSGSPALIHLDMYRLSETEIEDLGIEEYLRSDAVLVVEWADRAPDYLMELSDRVLWVEVDIVGNDERRIRAHRLRWVQHRPSGERSGSA